MKNSTQNIISIILLFLIAFQIQLNAQNTNTSPSQFSEPKFEHTTIADGLPENSVWAIYQDHHGFLWFGTQNGLAKYDGYSFIIYYPKPNDSLSISNHWIMAINEDNNNDLWIGTVDGLNRFNRATESFTRYHHNADDTSSIGSNYVRCIYQDSGGKLWIGTHDGLSLYIKEKNNFENFPVKSPTYSKKDSILQLPVYDILEEQETNNLFVATELPGLWMFDVTNKKYKKAPIQIDTMKQHIPSWVLSFYQSKDDLLWMATTNGLARLDYDNRKLNFYQIVQSREFVPQNLFNSVIEDSNGLIWVGSGNSGLISFEPETERFSIYNFDPTKPYSLNNNRVWSIYEDFSGNIWAGTWGGGVNKWDKKKWKVNSLKHDPGNINSPGNDLVNSICEDRKGIIWVGTNRGLDRYDRNKNSFTHYLHDPKNFQSLSSNLISCIIADRQKPGVLWIGTEDAGLNRFDSNKNIVVRYQNNPNNKNSLAGNSIQALIMDKSGIIWAGTRSGLSGFDVNANKFTNYKYDPNYSNSLSENEIRSLYEDNAGNIWIGTNKGGLNRLNPETGDFVRYISLTNDRSYSSIMTITQDANENLWVGTNLSGLHLFNPKTRTTLKSLTVANGLGTNGVRGILIDDLGKLWISTLNGLLEFNPETNLLKDYGIEDGLSSIEFNRGSVLKSESGEMFFGSKDGMITFRPENILDDPVPPKVVISSISLFNKPDEQLNIEGFISELEEINLAYYQNDLQFEYVGLHFGEPQKNQYRYILENFDDNWIDAGTQRKAIYSNLDPGEYVFRVKAANRDDIWNEKGAFIKIIISPPLWATAWAYILYGLIVISILYFIRRYELNRVKWKNQAKLDEVKLKEKEETDKLKSRFFANISHEFRTPLTLIMGPSEIIITETSNEKIKNQAGLIKKNAGGLLNLINQLLDLSKLEAGKLNLEVSRNDLVPFVKGVAMSFESLAKRKNISLKVYAYSEKIELYFDKEKISQVITNLLSNAFKFTPEGGEITVSIIQTDEQYAEISVKDSGIGIPIEEISKLFDRFHQVDNSFIKEDTGTGIGLAITKELVELHKGRINIESAEGKGAVFTVQLPIGKDHLSEDEIVYQQEPAETMTDIDDEKYLSITALEDNLDKNDIEEILVVEDNLDVREYIKSSLGEEYLIKEATDGEEGKRMAESIIPDLIISDVMMPKMDGNKLVKTLKKDEKTCHIPIILLTAKAGQESKLEGLETGADAYLTKPFDPKELKVRIKNLLNIRKKLQEKFSTDSFLKDRDRNKLSVLDEKFMERVIEVTENHLAEEEFSIEDFDSELGMGRVQIYRKLKALTGKSPSRYIRSIRLSKAKSMLEGKQGNVSEIAYSVGFSSPAYFTRCFKEEFGFPPSDLTK